jgi:hypothetical protein
MSSASRSPINLKGPTDCMGIWAKGCVILFMARIINEKLLFIKTLLIQNYAKPIQVVELEPIKYFQFYVLAW